MNVELITTPQSDLTVVNAARVSMNKFKTEFDEADAGLIAYLFKHRHWSPFAHARETFWLDLDDHEWLEFFANANLAGFEWNKELAHVIGSIWAWYENWQYLPPRVGKAVLYRLLQLYPVCTRTCVSTMGIALSSRVDWIRQEEAVELGDRFTTFSFRVKAPITVARQLVKHQQHLAWNEVSRRYVDEAPQIHQQEMRLRADKVKQGSSNELAGQLLHSGMSVPSFVKDIFTGESTAYQMLLESDVAPECARGVLPVSMMTEWIWTGSRERFCGIMRERLDPHAQKETTEIAKQIARLIDY